MMQRATTVLQNKLILTFGVKFVGIINQQGRLEDFVCNDDIPLDNNKKEMYFMCTRLLHSMENDFNDDLGPVNYVLMERKNLKFVSTPSPCGTIIAIMSKDADHITAVKEIKKITSRINQ